MRTFARLSGTCALATIWLGCSAEAVQRPPEPPVDWASLGAHGATRAPTARATPNGRSVADGYLMALSSVDLRALASLLHEDAHFAFAGREDVHGRAAVVRAHESLFGAFDARKLERSRTWRADGVQVIAWVLTGTHARPWRGAAGSGRPVRVAGLTILATNDEGAVTDVRVFFDEASVLAQVGLAPKGVSAVGLAEAYVGHADTVEATGAPEEALDVRRVREWIDALEEHDEARWLASLTDDVTVSMLDEAEGAHGKHAAAAWFHAAHRAFDDLDASVDDAWGIGPWVIVEYTLVGEQRGPLRAIPSRHGALLKMSIVDVIQVRDGKIAAVTRYANAMGAVDAR